MKLRSEKIKWLEKREEFINGAGSFIFTDFQGLSVKDMTDLRIRLRRLDATAEVVKNRLFKRVMGDKWDAVSEFFSGPTAVIYADPGSINEVCKVLADFKKTNENFAVRGGFLRPERVLSAADLDQIANIPDKNTLIAMFAQVCFAPVYGFHGACKAIISGIVYALGDLAKKKEAEKN